MIDLWRKEGINKDFLNFDVIDTYKDFGGIRIEDDVLITEDGAEWLSPQIVKTVEDIEKFIADMKSM